MGGRWEHGVDGREGKFLVSEQSVTQRPTWPPAAVSTLQYTTRGINQSLTQLVGTHDPTTLSSFSNDANSVDFIFYTTLNNKILQPKCPDSPDEAHLHLSIPATAARGAGWPLRMRGRPPKERQLTLCSVSCTGRVCGKSYLLGRRREQRCVVFLAVGPTVRSTALCDADKVSMRALHLITTVCCC